MANGKVTWCFSRSNWAVAAFYLLIGFEFLYMASPFAIYFYSVYGPGLRFIGETPVLAFLARFFMPHIVKETSSPLLDLHNPAGGLLAMTGALGFCAGAGQVYWRKLTKGGAVTQGIYRIIRHPQYASLLLCGFGLLLLWPRYLALVMFITMIFAYRGLARLEERECEARFGFDYVQYKARTGMFVPMPRMLREKLAGITLPGKSSVGAALLLYAVVLSLGIGFARLVEKYSLKSLYSLHDGNTTYISAVRIDGAVLQQVAGIMREQARGPLSVKAASNGEQYLAYVLPENWYVSEIPMYVPKGGGFESPSGYDRHLYKVVSTKVILKPETHAGEHILSRVSGREPVCEVVVDLRQQRIIGWRDSNLGGRYKGIPMAIY